jgi:CRP/FNR family transcriptional regulator
MHTVVRAELSPTGDVAAAVLASAGTAGDDADKIMVPTGGVVFQPGDERHHYRVEEGAIFHYVRWTDGSHDLIEVAFPGEIVGLGHLGMHISTAQAMVDSVVSRVSDEEVAHLIETDDRVPLLLASAGEREFDYMRDVSLNSGKRTPIGRLANYLIAVADIKPQSPTAMVADEVSTGYVAERLQMSVDTLEAALVGLQRKGLVAPEVGGLKITDLPELERVANAA